MNRWFVLAGVTAIIACRSSSSSRAGSAPPDECTGAITALRAPWTALIDDVVSRTNTPLAVAALTTPHTSDESDAWLVDDAPQTPRSRVEVPVPSDPAGLACGALWYDDETQAVELGRVMQQERTGPRSLMISPSANWRAATAAIFLASQPWRSPTVEIEFVFRREVPLAHAELKAHVDATRALVQRLRQTDDVAHRDPLEMYRTLPCAEFWRHATAPPAGDMATPDSVAAALRTMPDAMLACGCKSLPDLLPYGLLLVWRDGPPTVIQRLTVARDGHPIAFRGDATWHDVAATVAALPAGTAIWPVVTDAQPTSSGEWIVDDATAGACLAKLAR